MFIRIKAPIIKHYDVNGSGKVVVNYAVRTEDDAFTATVNGSGSVSVARVETSKFTAKVNGSGKINCGAESILCSLSIYDSRNCCKFCIVI
jgi:hypothetical protein